MKMSKELFVLSVCWYFTEGSVFLNPYQINMTEYYQMPDLYLLDDYNKCMTIGRDNSPQYCVVKTFIKPDNNSKLYNFIHEFSKREKQHFRHDKLERGICMKNCLRLVEELGVVAESFYTEKFPMDAKLTFDFINYTSVHEDRSQFDHVVNICINKRLVDNYNLTGYSSIEYCLRHDQHVPIDLLDISAALVIIAWLTIVIASSVFDAGKGKNATEKFHYLTPSTSSTDRILAAFSVKRNWYRLISETKPEHRDLRCINAIKAIIMFLITNGHVFWYILTMPMKNPEFIEKHYHNPLAMIMINGESLPNTFFFFSGFLLCILIDPILKVEKDNSMKLFIKAVVYRCIRLLPVMIAFIMIHATWLYHMSSGPIWEQINFPERQFCRKNWWINILFLNNYFSGDEKCLVQSWFLATDFHLSFIGLCILILILKHPALKWFTIVTTLSVSFCAVVTHVYVLELEPIFVIIPEFLRNQLFLSRDNEISYFYKFHSPSHINAGNYIIGLMFGLIYTEKIVKLKTIKKTWTLEVLWLLFWLSSFVISVLGFPFIESNIEPSIWTALYGGFMKHNTGVIAGVFTLGLIMRFGFFINKLFNLPMFRVLGRISYSYYLCHVFVMKLFMLGSTQPIEISDANVWSLTGAIYLFGNLFSIPFALFVEFPVNAVAKEVLKRFDNDKDSDNNNLNSVTLNDLEIRSK